MSVRNLRNFWMNTSVDGRESQVTAGPREKDGGMNINLAVNELGESINLVSIICYEHEGKLTVRTDCAGKTVSKYITYKTQKDRDYWIEKEKEAFQEGELL